MEPAVEAQRRPRTPTYPSRLLHPRVKGFTMGPGPPPANAATTANRDTKKHQAEEAARIALRPNPRTAGTAKLKQSQAKPSPPRPVVDAWAKHVVQDCGDCDEVCWSECSCSCHGSDSDDSDHTAPSVAVLPTPQRSVIGRHTPGTKGTAAATGKDALLASPASVLGFGGESDAASYDDCSECDDVCWSECSCDCHVEPEAPAEVAPRVDAGPVARSATLAAAPKAPPPVETSMDKAYKLVMANQQVCAASQCACYVHTHSRIACVCGCVCVAVQGPTFGRSERPGLAKKPDYDTQLKLDVAKADAAVRKRPRGATFGAPRHKPRTVARSQHGGTGGNSGTTATDASPGRKAISVVDVPMAVTKPRATGGYIAPPRKQTSRSTVKQQVADVMGAFIGAVRLLWCWIRACTQ